MRIVYDNDFENTDYLEVILTVKEIENIKNYKGAVKDYPYNPFNRKNKFNVFVRRSTTYNNNGEAEDEETNA